MLDSQAYFALPGVSSHMLIELMRSPLHCWAKYFDPKRQAEEPTNALRFGTLVHILTLTPEIFGDEYVLAESINRRTQAGKADYAALIAEGKRIVSHQDYQTALQIRKAIHEHPIARGLFQHGEPEKVITVPREPNRLPLKGRLDWLGNAPAIVELKTASDARKEHFLRDVYRYHYHLSAAYYRMLASRATGVAAEAIAHTFVVVESQPPHAVAVYHTAESILAEGRALWETQLARFDECWMMKTWPGYPVDVLERVGRPVGKGGSLRFEIEEGEIEL